MKKNYMIKLIVIIFIVSYILIFPCNIQLFKFNIKLSQEEKRYLENKKTIIFTGQINYAPFEFVDSNNDYNGMMIDLVRWISTEFGFKTKFIPQQFKKAQDDVLTGKADVITSFFYSKLRDRKFDFTLTIYNVPSSIFTYINRYDIQSLKDLNNKKISMQKGDIAEEYLKENKINAQIVYVKDFYEAVDKIVHLESDAVIGDEQIVWYHIFSKNYVKKIKKIGTPLYIGKNCMAVKQGNDILLSILNKGITKARQHGILEKLSSKWIGQTIKKRKIFVKYQRYFIISFVIIILIILLLFLNNFYLRRKVREKVKEIIENKEQLENNEKKLRTFINSIPDIICFVNKDDYIIEANNSFLTLLKLKGVDLSRYSIMEIVKNIPDYPENLKKLILEFSFNKDRSIYKFINSNKFKNKKTYTKNNFNDNLSYFNSNEVNTDKFYLTLNNNDIIRKEVQVELSNESILYFDLLKIPVYNNNREITNIISIGRDITDKKTIEKELLKVQKLNSLRNLASRFAHDFNNILTGIIANINLAQLKIKDEEVLELLKEAELASDSAKNISLQLLTFTKDVKTIKEVLNPVEVVKDAANFSLRGSKCKSNIILKSDEIYSINADRNQLIQAINNILINANQSMPEGGIIEITLENRKLEKFNNFPIKEDLYLIISIKDQGKGIEPGIINKIFDPFFTTKSNGNGLGLYSAYNICKNHNGYIFVDSKPNNGTIFHLLFPSTGEKADLLSDKSNIKAKHFKYNILNLDDEIIVQKAAKKIFEYFGCKIDAVFNDKEFFEQVKKQKYDIFIFDLVIPNSKGGLELIDDIKKEFPDTITIVSSGYTDNRAISDYKKIGFDYFLKKPYNIGTVFTILDDIEKNKKITNN